MEPNKSLRRVLGTLAHSYLQDDNEPGVDSISVEFTDETPHADKHGQYVAVNPDVRDTYGRDVSQVRELRIIADTLAHEVEHVNQSDLGSKQEIAEANPDMPQAAGMVANVLEDRYIDAQRMDRNPGQEVIHKEKVETIMSNHHRRPKVDTLLDNEGKVRALIEAALQLGAAGYVKGLEEFDEGHDLVEFAARWEWVLQQAEEAHDLDDRLDIIQSGVDLLREYTPDGTSGRDVDEAADDRSGDNLLDDEAPDMDDLDLDPSDLERDRDVSDGQPDTQEVEVDPDDLDDMDDLADEEWDTQEADDADGDPFDDLEDEWDDADQPDPDAGDQGADDGGAGDEPDADTDPHAGGGDGGDDGDDGQAPDDDADGDGGGGAGDVDGDEPADLPDDGGGGAGDGPGDVGGDTTRVDEVLEDYEPDELAIRQGGDA